MSNSIGSPADASTPIAFCHFGIRLSKARQPSAGCTLSVVFMWCACKNARKAAGSGKIRGSRYILSIRFRILDRHRPLDASPYRLLQPKRNFFPLEAFYQRTVFPHRYSGGSGSTSFQMPSEAKAASHRRDDKNLLNIFGIPGRNRNNKGRSEPCSAPLPSRRL